MSVIDRLRPNLSELMKQDPRSAAKKPLEAPKTEAPSKAEAHETFAERIAGHHEMETRAARIRETEAAKTSDQTLVEFRTRRIIVRE